MAPALRPTARRLFSVVNGAVALLFAASAAVQLNDPDPVRWIAIYLAAALACAPWPGRAGWVLPAGIGIVALGWSATLAGALLRADLREVFGSMQMKTADVEEAREALGLLIVAAWMAALATARRPRSRSAPAP